MRLKERATSLVDTGSRRYRNKVEKEIRPFLNDVKLRVKYGDSKPNPLKLIYVDPGDVSHMLIPHFWRHVCKYTTHVIGGEWDRNYRDPDIMYDEQVTTTELEDVDSPFLTPIEEYGLYRSMKKHFLENVPWRNTEIYAWLVQKCDERWGRYGSKRDIVSELEEIDDLYFNMKDNGYLSQKELARDDDSRFDAPLRPPEVHEVAVDVGRDGEIILDDGRHRFMVARILGIDEIPVRVLVRHPDWQELRRNVENASSSSELSPSAESNLGHPDIGQNILKELPA